MDYYIVENSKVKKVSEKEFKKEQKLEMIQCAINSEFLEEIYEEDYFPEIYKKNELFKKTIDGMRIFNEKQCFYKLGCSKCKGLNGTIMQILEDKDLEMYKRVIGNFQGIYDKIHGIPATHTLSGEDTLGNCDLCNRENNLGYFHIFILNKIIWCVCPSCLNTFDNKNLKYIWGPKEK